MKRCPPLRFLAVITAAMLVSLIAVSGYAQLQTGNIFGKTQAKDGSALPGVSVTMTGNGAPQTFVTDATGSFKAGEAALVIVPNVRHTGAVNVLEPRASAVLLEDIEEHVAGQTSAFATVHAIQPVFERLRVEVNVVFEVGRDPGYYAGVLNDDLKRFLSPWAYEDGEDILFGARIYRSEILAFIEGRDYVDHLTGLNLYHSFDGPPYDGIGYMTVGLDFILQPEPTP